jgi:hypothetical protein
MPLASFGIASKTFSFLVLTAYDFRIGSDQECLVTGIRLDLVESA